MRQEVDFCDLCFSDGMYSLAVAEYETSAGEHTVVCPSCAELVQGAGLQARPLRLPDGFIEDIISSFIGE